jgi:hypothetical protein
MTTIITKAGSRAIRLSRPDECKVPIHPVSLRFSDDAMNRAWELHHTAVTQRQIRISLLLAAVLVLAFSVIDHLVAPGSTGVLLLVRLMLTLIFLSVAAATGKSWWHLFKHGLLFGVVIAGGAGVTAIVVLTGTAEGNIYYAGLILAVMFAHGLLRLSFISATVATWLIIVMYFVVMAFCPCSELPAHVLANNLFFLTSANIMGMFASYGLEYFMKAEYWRAIREQEKSAELTQQHERKTNELEAARRIQLAMLPDKVPVPAGYTIAADMQTATEVGGDYYDFRKDEHNRLMFVIGDATGHGAQTAAMVAAMKLLFSGIKADSDPAHFLAYASNSIRNMGLRTLFIAAAAGRIDGKTVELAGAGIPPALVYRNTSKEVEFVHLKGIPLGGAKNYPYASNRFILNPGDVLLLVSDGFTECFSRDREMFGSMRLAEALKKLAHLSPDGIADGLRYAMRNWSGRDFPEDDMTLVVAKREGE